MPEVSLGALAIAPGHFWQPPPSAQQLATGTAANLQRPSPFHCLVVQGPGQTHRLLDPVWILAGRPGILQCLFCWTHGARRSIAWFAVDREYIATSTLQAARAHCTFLSAIASADIRSSFSCKDIAWMYCLLLGTTACRAGHIEDGRKPCPLACRRIVATLQSLHSCCRHGPHLGAPSSLRCRVRDVPKFPLLATASEHTRVVHAVT